MTMTAMTRLRRTFCLDDQDRVALDLLLLLPMLGQTTGKFLDKQLHLHHPSVLCQILLRKQTTKRRGLLYSYVMSIAWTGYFIVSLSSCLSTFHYVSINYVLNVYRRGFYAVLYFQYVLNA